MHVASAVLFLIGAVILFREARNADAEEAETEEEYAATRRRDPKQGLKAVVASFLVLFAAEWGDLSQLLTLSLVAKYDDPVSVFVGALGALLAVSGLAVRRSAGCCSTTSSCARCTTSAAAVCLVLLALTVYELLA